MKIRNGKFYINMAYSTSFPAAWVELDDESLVSNPPEKVKAVRCFLGIDYYVPKNFRKIQTAPLPTRRNTRRKPTQKRAVTVGGNASYDQPHTILFSNLKATIDTEQGIRYTHNPNYISKFREYIQNDLFKHKQLVQHYFDNNLQMGTTVPYNGNQSPEVLNIMYLITAPLFALNECRLQNRSTYFLGPFGEAMQNIKDVFSAPNRTVNIYPLHILDAYTELHIAQEHIKYNPILAIEDEKGKKIFHSAETLINSFSTQLRKFHGFLYRKLTPAERTLTLLGYHPQTRSYIPTKDGVMNQLQEFLLSRNINMIYAEGGETQWLRRAIKMVGFDTVLSQRDHRANITWCGASAGIINGGKGIHMAAGKKFLINPNVGDDVNILLKKGTTNEPCNPLNFPTTRETWQGRIDGQGVKDRCDMGGMKYFPHAIYPHISQYVSHNVNEWARSGASLLPKEYMSEQYYELLGDGECCVYPSMSRYMNLYRLDPVSTHFPHQDENQVVANNISWIQPPDLHQKIMSILQRIRLSRYAQLSAPRGPVVVQTGVGMEPANSSPPIDYMDISP
jgi:hypothetical protein